MAFLAPIAAGVAGAANGAASAIGGISTALGLIGTVVSAVGQISAANAQAQSYQLAATQAMIEGNARALEYRRQGNQVLRKVLETNATINARGAAGGIDPFSGSAGALSAYAFAEGEDEFTLATENAQMSILGGQANAASYRSAAASARQMGLINAAGTVIGGLAQASRIGGPSSASAATRPALAPTLVSSPRLGFASPIQRA